MKIKLNLLVWIILLVVVLGVACGEAAETLDDVLSCRVDEDSSLPQSESIECVESFSVGVDEFQAGDIATSVRFSPDSNRLYTLSSLFQTWDIESGSEVTPCSGAACEETVEPTYGRIHVDSVDGLVGVGINGRVYQEGASSELIYETPLYAEGGLEKSAYIDDKDLFLSYNQEVIHFHDRETGELAFDLEFAPLLIEEVAGGANGYAVSFSNDSRVFLFFTDLEHEGIVLEGHEAVVHLLKYSPDGSLVATFDKTGLLIVWDTSNGAERFRQMFEPDELFSSTIGDDYQPALKLAISPDNQLLVARGDTDRTVSIWSLASGEQIAAFEAVSLVYDMDISANGRYLATVTATTGVYDANASDCVRSNGSRISGCSTQGTLRNGSAFVYDISALSP